MATENTLKLRDIGRIETTRFVNTPGRGVGHTRAVPVKRKFLKHEIGEEIHYGAQGPRRGKFPKRETGSQKRDAKRVEARQLANAMHV